MPIKWKEQHGTVVVVREDVDDGVNHAAEHERQPPMSARTHFVREAPEGDSVNDQGRWRVEKVMPCNPKRIVEVQVIECFVHHANNDLCSEVAMVKRVPDGKEEQWKVWRHRTPKKRRLGKFILCAELLFDRGIDDEVRWNCVQSVFSIFNKSSADGLSVGSWLG